MHATGQRQSHQPQASEIR